MAAPSSAPQIDSIVSGGVLHKLVYVRRHVYPSDAATFLEFAQTDLQVADIRGLANALTNAKRAISNRVDTLLYAHGMRGFARRSGWGFPRKIAKLSEIGVSAPNVLNNFVNRKRNLLEHEYVFPETAQDVQDMIDIAELYLDTTEKFLEPGILQAVFGSNSTGANPGNSLVVLSPPAFGISFDFDQDQFQGFGSLGAGEPIPLAEVGEASTIKAFQAIVLAFLGKQVPVASCESEDVFWQRFM